MVLSNPSTVWQEDLLLELFSCIFSSVEVHVESHQLKAE